MNKRWRAWAEKYLECWDGLEASRHVKYSERSIYNQTYRMMRNDEVQEYIDERLKAMQMTADEAMVHLTRIARAPQAEALTPGGYDMQMVAEKYADLVSRVQVTPMQDGREKVTVIFCDRRRAIETVMKVHEKIGKKEPVNLTVKLGLGAVLDKVYGADGDTETEEST